MAPPCRSEQTRRLGLAPAPSELTGQNGANQQHENTKMLGQAPAYVRVIDAPFFDWVETYSDDSEVE